MEKGIFLKFYIVTNQIKIRNSLTFIFQSCSDLPNKDTLILVI